MIKQDMSATFTRAQVSGLLFACIKAVFTRSGELTINFNDANIGDNLLKELSK